MKIIRNAVRCNICGNVIESTTCHDFVTCKRGACAVYGGHEYLKRASADISIVESDDN